LTEAPAAHGMLGWSDCADLARARVAARERSTASAGLLRRALDVLEENSHAVLLDADRAFAMLAQAATEAGEEAISKRAIARANHFRTRRFAAAGAAWGGGSDSHAGTFAGIK